MSEDDTVDDTDEISPEDRLDWQDNQEVGLSSFIEFVVFVFLLVLVLIFLVA